ncbi:MAG: hypothetical protein QNK35_11535, partial [Bacteroides sp.]|nr:hypothetical protein [Bacteroides sp.]
DAEKTKADAEKTNAEADTAKNKAVKEKWDISQTKGLKGKITVSNGVGYKAELIAYEVIDAIAKEISGNVSTKVNKEKLIILGQEDLSEQVAMWNMIELKLDTAISHLDNSIKIFKPEDASIPAATPKTPGKKLGIDEVFKAGPAILGAAADIAAFFKTNSSITSRKIALNEKALKASVRNCLNLLKINIKNIEKEVSIYIPEFNFSPTGNLFQKFTDLTSKVEELTKIRFGILSTPEKEFTQLLDSKTAIKEEIIKQIDAEIDAVHELISTLTTQADDTISPLDSVATVDFANEHPDANFLHLSIVSQEGEIVISESTFLRSRIFYLGGAVVSYFLCNHDGACLHSGTIQRAGTATYTRKKGILVATNKEKEPSEKNN